MALRARLTPPREPQVDWPWHEVKCSSIPASVIYQGERRMEAENFLAAGFRTRQAIESKASGWIRLREVAQTSQPSRLKGIQVRREFGTPFLAATQVYDVRPVARKWLSLNRTSDHERRFVPERTILLTCSGNVGRATLAHSTITGALISHDLLRLNASEDEWWGWTYAYLRAPTVREMMKSAQYGHIIKHLEISHIDELPVLRLRKDLRIAFNRYARRILAFRDRAHSLSTKAEEEYSKALGTLPTVDDGETGFVTKARAMFGVGRRLEANYHNPVARAAERVIQASALKVEVLDRLVERVYVPGRFKHVYGDEGIPYLDSAQIMEISPDVEKKVLSLKGEKKNDYLVDAGTLLMPCSGQLHGVVGSVVLATSWHENKVLTNHILRIVPKSKPPIRIGYLLTVLSHPVFGRPRILKGAFGSSVPEIAPGDVQRLSVPRLPVVVEDRIADLMEEASRLRTQADQLEEQISAEAEDQIGRFLLGEWLHVEAPVGYSEVSQE